jgi:ankyrin repeat protein
MSFMSLSNETLIQIVDNLDNEGDINSAARVSRRLYNLFNYYLYRHNIELHESRALLWAAQRGQEATIRRLLSLGADLCVRTSRQDKYTVSGVTWNIPLNALYLAALKGHPHIARLLLEAGINDNEHARKRESMPLYYALVEGHEDVSLVLLEHIGDIQRQLMWTPTGVTALHVASCLELPSLVRHLLGRGADVNAEDALGMTPLHYAMFGNEASCPNCSSIPLNGMRHRVDYPSKAGGYQAEIETASLLLSAGADPDVKHRHSNWLHHHNARSLALRHPDKRMRKLFTKRGWTASLTKPGSSIASKLYSSWK